jgi:hypothetical protein
MARLTADTAQGLWRRQAGTGQEYAGELFVTVLACMQEPGRWAEDAYNGRELDYFRPCPDDNCNAPGISVL